MKLNTYRKTQIIQQQYYLKLWRQVLDYVYQQQDSADKLPPLLHEGHAKGLSPSQKRGYCYQAYFWLTLLPTLPKKIWIVSAYQSKIDSLIEGRSESLAEINEFMTNLRAAEVVKTTKLVALNRQPDSSFQFRLNIKLNTAIPSKRIALCNLNH